MPRSFGAAAGAFALVALGAFAVGGCDNNSSGPLNSAAPSGVAFVSTDYASTSVSLYDPMKSALVDDCVHTGGGLAQDLSGDVTLPSQPQKNGELTVIDSGSSVLTFVDPTTCKPRIQLSVSTGGFKANPRDVVSLSTHKAYVTRYELNANPSVEPGDFDDGDDLLIIDPGLVTATGRIALSAYATPAADGTPTQARPDRAVLAEGHVFATLVSADALFAAYGPGRVVIVDPVTDAVTGTIDFPTLKDCSGLSYSATDKMLYVSCGGGFDANQLAASGVVEISLAGAAPAIVRTIQASAIGTEGLNFAYVTTLGPTAFVGTLGSAVATPPIPDAFYAAPLAGGPATMLRQGGAYNLGVAVADPGSRKIFLPDGDATAPVVHVFVAAGASAVALPDFASNPAGGLPPRLAVLY